MTKAQERELFIELCKYIKDNILKYDDTKKTPKYLIMRLIGLHYGKFIANNQKQDLKVVYDYKTILLTFKYSVYDINKCIDNNKERIKDENHLINLIFTFVEKDINNVVEKLKQKELSKQKMDGMDNSQLNAPKSEYIPKTDDTKFKKELM